MQEKIKLVILKVKSVFFTASFIRYLVIGFSTFGLQIFLLNTFTDLLNLEKNLANAYSLGFSMVFNFTLTNFWTFKAGNREKKKKLGKYLTLAAFNYLFSLVSFNIMTGNLKIDKNIAVIINTGLVVCWNFILYKFWVFKVSDKVVTVDYQDPVAEV